MTSRVCIVECETETVSYHRMNWISGLCLVMVLSPKSSKHIYKNTNVGLSRVSSAQFVPCKSPGGDTGALCWQNMARLYFINTNQVCSGHWCIIPYINMCGAVLVVQHYASVVLAMSLCLSVCLSVCYMPLLYQNGCTHWAAFWHTAFPQIIMHTHTSF